MKDVLQYVQYEDLTPEQQNFADLIGMELFKTLVEKCGGSSIYIPKADSIGRNARNALIREEFNGNNIRDLAKKYQLSHIQIRSIVAPKK